MKELSFIHAAGKNERLTKQEAVSKSEYKLEYCAKVLSHPSILFQGDKLLKLFESGLAQFFVW